MNWRFKLSVRLSLLKNAVLAAAALAACSADHGATTEAGSDSSATDLSQTYNYPRHAVASVTVSPALYGILTGASVQLVATLRDSDGRVLTGRVVTWTSSAAAIASVSSSGRVTGVSAGNATIRAAYGTKYADAAITVTAAAKPVASLALAPASASILAGTTVQLVADARDSSGAVVTGAPVTWTSSAPTLVVVSAAGLATGIAPGTSTVTATSGAARATATVTVTTTGGGPVGTPVLTRTFTVSQYPDKAAYDNDHTLWFWTEDKHLERQTLIPIASAPAALAGLGLDQAVRYTYDDSIAGGGDYTIGRTTSNLSPMLSEAWTEVWVRFSANFTTLYKSPTRDFKGIAWVLSPDGYGRFQANAGGVGGALAFNAMWPAPPTGGGSTTADNFGVAPDVWNGRWVRFRAHSRVGTFGGNNTLQSVEWADEFGNVIAARTFTRNLTQNGTIALPRIARLRCFELLSAGTGYGTMTIDLLIQRVYATDPGWGI